MSQLEIREVEFSKIIFDADIYPRKSHNPLTVQRYAACLDQIEERRNFIVVSANMKLLDGRHRHLAYQKNFGSEYNGVINVYVRDDVTTLAQEFSASAELNSEHGDQLSQEDKRAVVIRLYSKFGYSVADAAATVKVRKDTALEWTKGVREEEDRILTEKIFDMWMQCYSQDDISERLAIPQQTTNRKIDTFTQKVPGNLLGKSHENDQDFAPPLFNIWTFSRKTNGVSHFGNSEQRIVDNLLYLYTEPFDIVVDPFAGGGSTIDVCKRRLRRYYVSDRKPIVERESEIRKHDLAVDGLPPLHNRWSDVTLTYLDPPYWRQAAGQYSDDPTDLANMPLELFTKTLADIVKGVSRKQSKGVIALLIQPTQWSADNKQFTDHVNDLVTEVGNKRLVLENRVSCPYSTEQYNAQQVEYAKANKKLLVLTRELIIWRIV